MAEREPSGEANVGVDGSQGVQVGSGNTMYNSWLSRQPLDPASLAALNPHVAVARLRKLSHDELVDFFAGAKLEDVSEILGVFGDIAADRAVAMLGDINRRKATQLIDDGGGYYNLSCLGDLPEAAEAITSKAGILGWADAEPLKSFVGGYARKYSSGHVYWSEPSGVAMTTGAIDDFYWTEGSPEWGFPVEDTETMPISPHRTVGDRQEFQAGMAYSSKLGTFLITDVMCYQNEGGSGGWLGFPRSGRKRNKRLGYLQIFEGGAIYSYVAKEPEGLRSFAVRHVFMSALPDREWRPVSQEAAVMSSSGKQGVVQRFEIWLDPMFETAVYWDGTSAPVMVAPEIWDYYRNLGMEKSRLGLPVQKPERLPPAGSRVQEFEGGKIYRISGKQTVAVPGEVEALIKRRRSTDGMIGYPLSEELPAGADGAERIQFFEHGVVTRRNGKYDVWVRPDPDLAPPRMERAPVETPPEAPGADYGPSRPEPRPFKSRIRGSQKR